MGVFRKKCYYCRDKIEKRKEIFRDVKVLGFHGTYNKAFCNEEHANLYEQEVKNKNKKCGSGCCG